jgi:hypothetical protein
VTLKNEIGGTPEVEERHFEVNDVGEVSEDKLKSEEDKDMDSESPNESESPYSLNSSEVSYKPKQAINNEEEKHTPRMRRQNSQISIPSSELIQIGIAKHSDSKLTEVVTFLEKKKILAKRRYDNSDKRSTVPILPQDLNICKLKSNTR